MNTPRFRFLYIRLSLSIFLFFGFLALNQKSFAEEFQSGSIRGRITDAVTKAPLPGVNVSIVSTTIGTATNIDGEFIIDDLEPGIYSVQATFIGFEPVIRTDVVVQSSRPTILNLELRETAIELGGITVETSLFTSTVEANTSVQALGAEEIRRTPGGLNDISRTLLSLPGITGGVDNRNDLIVRGGGPSENAYYLDGVPIPQINHFATQGASGGAVGLLNIDFIEEAEFFTGGFPARYGDALSSVLLVKNREGSPDGIAGDFTVGASETALTFDGPFGEKGSWLLSARRSYLQFLFSLLGLPIRPNYWDFQAHAEYQIDRDNRLTFVGIGAIDQFDIITPEDPTFEQNEILESVLENDQWSYTNGLVWRRLLRNGYLSTTLSRSLSNFTFADRASDGTEILRNDTRESENHLRLDADFRLQKNLTLGIGAGSTLARVKTSFFEQARPGTSFSESLRFSDDLYILRGSTYGQFTGRFLGERMVTTVGLRLDADSFIDRWLHFSPRFTAQYQLSPAIALNASTGRFHQAPEYVSLMIRDETGTYVNRGLPFIRADHYVAGISVQPRSDIRVTFEGYYKQYADYPVSRSDARISLANLGGDYGFIGAEPLLGIGTGRAYGTELFVQKKPVANLYGSAAYTLAWSEFAGADQVLKPSSWDVRHSATLNLGYRLGRKWEVGARWRYLSGRPFTPFDPVRSAAEYALTRRGVADYSRLNSERTSAYHRLDIRVDRRFSLRGWNAVIYLDLQNIYNRTNLFGYSYTEDPAYPDNLRPIDNIGLLPNVGFSVEW